VDVNRSPVQHVSGEHPFSKLKTPTAQDRPDANDLKTEELSGQKIQEKLQYVTSASPISDEPISGCHYLPW
jgi:hypothetical protein